MRSAILLAACLAGCSLDASAVTAIQKALWQEPGAPAPVASLSPAASDQSDPGAPQVNVKVETKTETRVEVTTSGSGSGSTSPSSSGTLRFSGGLRAEREVRAPMIGATSISGCLGLDDKVKRATTELGDTPLPFLATAKPDGDGMYSLAVKDPGDSCLAILVVGWDDQDGDGAFTWTRPGRIPEPLAGSYVYHRQAGKATFTRGWRGFNFSAIQTQADFAFQ